ncbi:MAG: hypothetical protein WCD12_06860 [Candidatus Binatus sp.]|uniref:hypothetical protein n=1 Tax=Candidatus Binatus sp. TaxID=2811406 RepID=UPI003C784BB1
MGQDAGRQAVESKDRVHQAAFAATKRADDGEVEAILRQPRQQLLQRTFAFRVLVFPTLKHRRLRDCRDLKFEIVVAADRVTREVGHLRRRL